MGLLEDEREKRKIIRVEARVLEQQACQAL